MSSNRFTSSLHLFLGGGDLEMTTIGTLARQVLGEARVHDAGLAWGARASAYADVIAAVVEQGERAVLVELADDLLDAIPRAGLIVVDHHGELAGADRPSSLRQIFDLLALPEQHWSRWFSLVAANDIGHIPALRAHGASPQEIREIRDADRRAQGVDEADEVAARASLAIAKHKPHLTVVTLDRERTSPVGDFTAREYGGTDPSNLLVRTPLAIHFFGAGDIVRKLADEAGAWYGGALPERGFWGAPIARGPSQDAMAARIAILAEHDRQCSSGL